MLSQFVDSFRRSSITRSRHSSLMEGQSISNIQLPPGFRFHPSDEELIIHYLRKKATSHSIPASIIAEVNLYNHNPWDLPKKALFGEDEWYFFSPRDRKYPNGARPNRRAASGYWKATGKDKPIFSSHGSQSIGVKKALVFYKGHPPNGVKTDWIMQEYRLLDTMIRPLRLRGSMRLDDWVLCRVRQKGNVGRNMSEDGGSPSINMVTCFPSLDQEPCLTDTNTNVDMAANYLYNDCPMLAYIFASQDVPQTRTTSNINIQAGKNNNSYSSVYEDSTDTGNSPFAASFFNSMLNPSKRKPSEGNHSGNYFPTSNILTNNEAECGDTSQKLYNDGNGEELNFCTQYQFQGTTFNLDPSNSFIEFQHPNQFDFTD